MQEAHFFDIDTLIKIESKAWIIDKSNPTVPIMKIAQSDLNLFKSGLFRKQNNKIEFGDDIYWLPEDFILKLKIAVKKSGANYGNLAISVKEFRSKEIIESKDFELNLDVIMQLKNKVEDIYLICSKHFKYSHESILEKLIEKLKEEGIKIKNFYFITENFYDLSKDDIIFRKLRLLLQHLIGYKTDDNKFMDNQIEAYQKVSLYDTDIETLKFANDINNILFDLYSETPDSLKLAIKERLKSKPECVFNKVNDNFYNKISSVIVDVKLDNIIKKFQIFKAKD
jgi:hypothetical protein